MRIVSFFRKLKNREHGFTLSELLVATLVFGVLVAIAVPAYLNQRATGDLASLKADLINAAVNVDQAKVENGGKYPTVLPSGIVAQTPNATFKYSHPYDGLGYCLQIIAGSQTLFKSNTDTTPNSVDCTFEYALPTTVLRGTMPNNGYAPLLSWQAVRGATTYDIYKDNVKVFTYAVSALEVNNIAFSQTLSAMNPDQTSVFYVVVGDGATTSNQSNTISLTAPTPPPSAVTAKVVGSDVASPTQQIYTITWNAVQYAKSYELWDSVANQRIAQIPAGTLSYQYTNTRGTSNSVVVRAVNTFGTSPDSNTLTLSSSWAKPVILSATSRPADGMIDFKWQTGTGTALTPDWGTPGYKVLLTVTNATTSQVYTYDNITTPTYTPSTVFQRTTHTASIVVTTATGVTLQSDPVTIEFPPPPAPTSVTGFTSDANGTSTIKNNRLVWTASACTQSSTPQYLITKLDSGMGNPNSGWVTGTTWNIPDAQLAQSVSETYQIQSRCSNGNGVSSASTAVQTVFTTGILTPSSPAGLKNDHNFVVSWTAVTCATGINAQYTVSQTKKNSAVVANTFVTTGTSQTFSDLTPGTDQTVSVMARCAKFGAYPDPSTIGASSSWSNYASATSWTTLLPAPPAPALTLTQTSVYSATQMTYQVSWNSVQWAQTYDVFDAANPGTPLTTVGNATTSVAVKVTRGTTMNVYVRAKNSDATGPNSNTVALTSVWPTPVILSTTTDPYAGNVALTWQTGTDTAPVPDWGTPGYTVEVDVKNLTTGQTYAYKNIAARSFTTPDVYQRVDHSVSIIVTTATGATLSSAPVTVSFPPPGPPSVITGLSSNGSGVGPVKNDQLVWNASNCGIDTPQYFVTNTTGGTNSGWIAGSVSGSTVSWNITQAWLDQGINETFTVAARCSNPNGVSTASPTATVTFKTIIVTPAAPSGVTNNSIDTISWNALTCPKGTTAYYNVVQTKQNGSAVNINTPTANTSLTLTGLAPNTVQTAAVQARCQITATSTYSGYSALSAATTWTTPVPAPAAPVLSGDNGTMYSPTQNKVSLSWNAVQWATSYEIHDGTTGALLDTVTAPTTTDTVLVTRGTTRNFVVNAVNVTGTSPDSNKITATDVWPTPVILTANSQLDGTINFAWQTGVSPNFTPDWGTPGYSVILKVTRVSDGLVAYTSPAITTSGVLTPAMPSREQYSAVITVTTATGVKLTSAPVTVDFPKPAAPASPAAFTSDNLGSGPIKNDRLTWSAVTCPTSGATVSYYTDITSPTGMPNSTWQSGTTFNVPQSWLVQGASYTFRLLAKCNNANGDSAWSPPVATSFTTGIITPNAPLNLRTSGTSNIAWDAVSCATGTTPAYQVTQTLKNGAVVNLVYTTTATTYALSGLTAGANQSAYVQALCSKATAPTGVSSYSAPSSTLSWRAPLPQPVAPVVTIGTTTVASPTISNINVSWSAVPNAEYYDVFNATTGVKITSVTSPTTIAAIPVNRGSTGTLNVYVKAGNFTYASTGNAASNTVILSAPWPTANIISLSTNQNKQIVVQWQNSGTDPDWGDPNDRITVYAEQPAGTLVYTSPVQSGTGMTTVAMANTNDYTVYIKVTTANGEVLTSNKYVANFTPPAAPTAVPTNITFSTTGTVGPDTLSWTDVTCTTPGTTPQYFVRQFVPGSTTTEKFNSGWTISGTSYVLPAAQVDQGVVYSYSVFGRCVSANGSSTYPAPPVVTAPLTNVLTPPAATNFVVTSNNDNGTATVSWDAVTCPANLTTGYMLYYSKKNDIVGSSALAAYTNTTLNLTGLTPGKSHTAYVVSRCYDPNNAQATSLWANGNPSNSASWTTPIPIPAAPVLTTSQTSDNNLAGNTSNLLSWAAVPYATSYSVYDADSTVKVYSGTALSFSINVNKNTTRNFYVVATNATGTGANSNTVTIAPKYKQPAILTSNVDDFTLNATFTYDALATNWGTGAKARMISTGYVASAYMTTGTSYSYPNHVRANKTWYLEITTVTGLVLTSPSVVISPDPMPTVNVVYNPNTQRLTYNMDSTPSTYGLGATNSNWLVEISGTPDFADTYAPSNASGTDPSTSSVTVSQPAIGGRYYVRYTVTRNSDGASLVSSTAVFTIATEMIDRNNDGVRDMPTIDTSGTTDKVDWTPMYSSGPMNTGAVYRDPSSTDFTGCVIYPVLDFIKQGSQGIICFYPSSGVLSYYDLNSSGNLGSAKVIGNGWNMYSELTVVQNFWGDNRPAIVAIKATTGTLEVWQTNVGGTMGTVDRASGTGWGLTDGAHISSIQSVNDWNGYGSTGLIATSTTLPFTRYYGFRHIPTQTGSGNIIPGVSLQSSWDAADSGLPAYAQPYYPTTSAPNNKSSFAYNRGYGNLVVGGIVVPAVGYGPNNYLDVAVGTGSGSWDYMALAWGFSNQSTRKYVGQNKAIAVD